MVFQDPATALNARMSIREQLMDPMIVHKVDDKASREARVHELIEMVGLPESVLDALPGQMSGGQRQRVAIARALSLNPDAIIADEPTSALDVSVRAQILNLLTDLKKELGLAMVFISHDIQTVRYISDRIVVMNGGLAVEEGNRRADLRQPEGRVHAPAPRRGAPRCFTPIWASNRSFTAPASASRMRSPTRRPFSTKPPAASSLSRRDQQGFSFRLFKPRDSDAS